MAAPRIFVSSTYYDLRHVRAEIENFGRETGLDMVLFEKGDIPYIGQLSPEDACYREIEKCDIVVSIIGGSRGSTSKIEKDSSISELEVKTALELGRQLFIFVDADVLTEYQTFTKNPNLANEINWRFVDSTKIFEFLKHLYGLESNNPIFSFREIKDITRILRDQILGLFQDLLQERSREKFESHVSQLIEAIKDAERVRQFLERQESANQEAIKDILFTRHPLFKRLQQILSLDIRIFFETVAELQSLLKLFDFREVPTPELSEENKEFMFWYRDSGKPKKEFIGIHKCLFKEDGSLEQLEGRDEWKDEWVKTSMSSKK